MLLRESGAHLTVQATSRKTSVVAPEMVSIIGMVMGGRLRKMRKLRPRAAGELPKVAQGLGRCHDQSSGLNPSQGSSHLENGSGSCHLHSVHVPATIHEDNAKRVSHNSKTRHPEIVSISPKAVALL